VICLHVCPSCARHVRSIETTCPFCEEALPDDFGVCGEPRAAGRPLTRAAFLLMSATALTACGKSPGAGGGADIYGPPPVDARPDSGTTTAPEPVPQPVAVYGPAPVAGDASPPTIKKN
jgi:hypothetical protein